MLKRLIDEEGLDERGRQLSDLFRSAAPFEVDPFRKRRILVRLERRPSLRARAVRFWLRPIMIAALLVSGTAMAELGHLYVWHGSGFFGLVGAQSATSSSVKLAPHALPAAKRAPSAKLGTSGEIPAAAQPAEAAPVETAPAPAAPLESSASAPRAAPKSARPRAESSEDATHVVEAIQALRTERDPARAQALLNDYLKANPRGALSGDALALSIEAASAQHDPRAAEYARRYLASYPKGKYRELAKRALEAAQH
ncbi:MAG TPA: hypothetical protein VGJ91_03185 [Polyangiaceae bacterium]|jgi:hypothetical protein